MASGALPKSAGPAPPPPRTHGAVVQGARAALRRFREDRAAGRAPKRSPSEPWRLLLDAPLPVAADVAAGGLPLEGSPFGVADEGDWPGGQAQRFRAWRKFVEPLLDGYPSSFLGMLESPSDGLGVWQLPDMVVAGLVVNATFPAFARLCAGDFGAQPTRPDQAVVVAADWTRADDIGQPWDRTTSRAARELIDDAEWRHLYSAKMLRTAKGRAFGCVVGGWGLPWRVYAAEGADSSTLLDEVVLECQGPQQPAREEIAAALNAAAERRRAEGGGGGEGRGGGFKLWW
ncbi:hypothetical protein Rsub_12948 [Raphidocelis subcapitata]|uniref:DUF1995 domain-containing protein n=1 Tax=Raphidocelis subcapitata TaxID=307507 RepID=A0A2V0PNX3_9CHLO|nr:hypothetical protein Rsub_12948 [Raphidocelis subcapitata]|eukprot:GBF99833.1 hypothetical protein Rsub_12948 [Raphidocelis subcapitata]